MSGDLEPTDEQCDWPSDIEDEDSALAEDTENKLKIEANSDEGEGNS